MKFNVFALALICALAFAPVVADVAKKTPATDSNSKKTTTTTAKSTKAAESVETEVAAADADVTDTDAAKDKNANDACPACPASCKA